MKNKLELGQFIHWDEGQNYPFGACMSKLIERVGGDTPTGGKGDSVYYGGISYLTGENAI